MYVCGHTSDIVAGLLSCTGQVPRRAQARSFTLAATQNSFNFYRRTTTREEAAIMGTFERRFRLARALPLPSGAAQLGLRGKSHQRCSFLQRNEKWRCRWAFCARRAAASNARACREASPLKTLRITYSCTGLYVKIIPQNGAGRIFRCPLPHAMSLPSR